MEHINYFSFFNFTHLSWFVSSLIIVLIVLIFASLDSKTKTKTLTYFDQAAMIALALFVGVLVAILFSGRPLIDIELSCEPLINSPGFSEKSRVFFTHSYHLFIRSISDPNLTIHIPDMPSPLFTFLNISDNLALDVLYRNLEILYNMLDQVNISFELRMNADPSFRDELEINKLKTILNLIFKIEAILKHYVPSFEGRDLSEHEWMYD